MKRKPSKMSVLIFGLTLLGAIGEFIASNYNTDTDEKVEELEARIAQLEKHD